MTRYHQLLIASLFILFITFKDSYSQKLKEQREQVWVGYNNQIRLTKRFGSWLDVHYRRTDNFVNHPFQFVARVGAIYFISDNFRATAGYAYFRHFEEGTRPTHNEHRPWQQLWLRQDYNGVIATHGLRLEQRFREKVRQDQRESGYNFNHRIRYNLTLFVPLKGKKLVPKTPFIAVTDEVMVNMGKEIIHNYFDQNRLFVGLGYQFNSHLNAQLGYMNIFQQSATPNKYFNTHSIRFMVFHSLDLSSQESN